MSHVQDLWFSEVPDPNNPRKTLKVKTSRHGMGMRYKARWVDDSGVERSKSFPDKKKGEADAFLVSVNNSLLERAYVDPNIGKTPFKAVCYEWLKGTSPDPNTRAGNKRQLELHILPFFEKYTVARAGTVKAVRDWLEWIQGRKLEQSYVALIFKQLRSIMRMAVRERYISSNPCESKSLTVPRAPRKKIIPWEKSKLDAISAAIGPRERIVVPLGAGLGLRRGELLALDLEQDLNRREGTLHVQRQIRKLKTAGGGWVFSLPKHDHTRMTPVGDFVLRELDAYVEEFPPMPVTLPWKFADGPLVTVNLLIVREDGRPWHGEWFHNQVWVKAFRTAGIPMRRFVDGMHALRHFYASMQLANLVSVRELAEYMGHQDASITLNTYGHLMPDSHSRSRAAVDAVWSTASDSGTASGRPGCDGLTGGEGGGVVDLDAE